MKFVIILASLGAVVLAGCSTIPTAGPTVNDVLSQAATNGQRYFDLVDVDNHVVTTLLSRPAESFHNQFLSYGKPLEPKIGIGDTLSVSIWEAAPGGLFGAAPTTGATGGAAGGSTSVTIPAQVVGTDGGISVPFAGRIRVTGRTPLQAQDEIQQQLSGYHLNLKEAKNYFNAKRFPVALADPHKVPKQSPGDGGLARPPGMDAQATAEDGFFALRAQMH